MSLFKDAADLIHKLIQGSDPRHRPEIDKTLGELHTAHRATTASMAEDQPGKRITIDGSSEAGFLVSLNDGNLFRTLVVEAADEVDALEQALEHFGNEVKDHAVPQSEVAPPSPPAAEPDAPAPSVEKPFAGDAGTVDVTRGRVGDEEPDADTRPGAQQSEHEAAVAGEPVPGGVTEAAPPAGTHLGNDQALSYEAKGNSPGEGVTASVEEHPNQAATLIGGDLPAAETAPEPVQSEPEPEPEKPTPEPEPEKPEPEAEPMVPAASAASPLEQIAAAEERAKNHDRK